MGESVPAVNFRDAVFSLLPGAGLPDAFLPYGLNVRTLAGASTVPAAVVGAAEFDACAPAPAVGGPDLRKPTAHTRTATTTRTTTTTAAIGPRGPRRSLPW